MSIIDFEFTEEQRAIAYMNMVSILSEENMKNDNGTLEHSPVDKAQQAAKATDKAEIDRLNAKNSELQAALQPFARFHCNDTDCLCHNCAANKALANTTTDWLDKHDAKVRKPLEVKVAKYKLWYDAVTNEGVITHVGWLEEDARSSLQKILDWHVAVALDPKVSNAAQNLIAEARQEQIENSITLFTPHKGDSKQAAAFKAFAVNAIRNQSEVTEPADLKRCCDVVDCTCSLDD